MKKSVSPVYEIYESDLLMGAPSRLDVALISAKNKNQVTIYEKDKEGKRKLAYDASTRPKNVLLEAPVVSQYPELIRGCEVTALAMFLSYYTNQTIDKMTLAGQLRIDETPLTTVEGMNFYGDMHKGFVGSLTERAEPAGLGVYIEPLYDIAKDYVEGLYNTTGVSFEQALFHTSSYSGSIYWLRFS